MNTETKRGRKPKPHITKDNRHINGLRYREHDKRWILSDGRTFTEPDERKAVERFERMTGGHFADSEVIEEKIAKFVANNPRPQTDDNSSLVIIPSKLPLWEYVAMEIKKRPLWVAEQTGDERIGYLDVQKPKAPLPSPKDLEKIWTDHAECSSAEKRYVKVAWNDFLDTTGVKSLSEIDDSSALAFQDAVKSRGWSAKTMRHRCNRIRRMVSFAMERKTATAEMTRLQAVLKFKIKAEARVLKPMPISPSQFQALIAVATGENKAMLLLMLNCALYLQEVVRVRWDEVSDGCLITNRQKTGGCLRVAVLWQETIDALAAVKSKGESVFVAEHGLELTISGAGKRFRKLREEAHAKKENEKLKINEVTGSQLRDGAYQAMAEANINSDLCKLVVGHSCGLKDNYVLRSPSMVGPACLAIHTKYFPS